MREFSQLGQEKSLTRRVVVGAGALGTLGVLFGRGIQGSVGSTLSSVGGLANFLPGGNQFRIYTVTNGYPSISLSSYRLSITGHVRHQSALSLSDLESFPQTKIDADFQCVTGWRVPNVRWSGVLLRDLIAHAAPTSEVKGFGFYSADGIYTESLTYAEAIRSDVMIATRMYGAPLSQAHGGPARLYVAPMYGYKSIKWLSEIRAVPTTTPGYWEQQGYAVEAWIGSSNGRNDPPVV